MDHHCAPSQMGASGGHASLVSTLRPCSGSGSCEEVVQYWTKNANDVRKDGMVELALELAWRLARLGGNLGVLACLGIFAKMPNAAKYTQLGQVTPSSVSSS